MAKRKYTKKSDYWNDVKGAKEKNLHKKISDITEEEFEKRSQRQVSLEVDWEPQSFPLIESRASAYSRTSTSGGSKSRVNVNGRAKEIDEYSNIDGLSLPFEHDKCGGISVRRAISLSQKAYAHVPAVTNTVNLMAEFANSELRVEGGSKQSREFIKKWFQKIKIWDLKDQYFREYYKSGNVLMYRVLGDFSESEFKRIQAKNGVSNIDNAKASFGINTIPIKYLMLNPVEIGSPNLLSFETPSYHKVLTDFEIKKLKNPQTDHERELFKNLPLEVKRKLKTKGMVSNNVSVPLSPKYLVTSFYKKQDYEPFAIPFCFPVLKDINLKMEMKKIDQAISRTVEHVILLITMGDEKHGPNPESMRKLQAMFQVESLGRVLVSDYTTEATFVIPELKKVLGKEKYEVLNDDIREGLQNVVFADSKYQNNEVKTRIFLKRLKQAREQFLNDFFQEEVKRVCQSVGFVKYPTITFEEVDLQDDVALQRVITRLLELGILTPEQGMEAIRTKKYPSAEELELAQEEYLEQRKQGMYLPLVADPTILNPEEEAGNAIQTTKVSKEVGRPVGASKKTEHFKVEDISTAFSEIDKFVSWAIKETKVQKEIKRMHKSQKELIETVCEKIVASNIPNEWKSVFSKCISGEANIDHLQPHEEVLEIMEEHPDVTQDTAAVLFASKYLKK